MTASITWTQNNKISPEWSGLVRRVDAVDLTKQGGFALLADGTKKSPFLGTLNAIAHKLTFDEKLAPAFVMEVKRGSDWKERQAILFQGSAGNQCKHTIRQGLDLDFENLDILDTFSNGHDSDSDTLFGVAGAVEQFLNNPNYKAAVSLKYHSLVPEKVADPGVDAKMQQYKNAANQLRQVMSGFSPSALPVANSIGEFVEAMNLGNSPTNTERVTPDQIPGGWEDDFKLPKLPKKLWRWANEVGGIFFIQKRKTRGRTELMQFLDVLLEHPEKLNDPAWIDFLNDQASRLEVMAQIYRMLSGIAAPMERATGLVDDDPIDPDDILF